MGTLNIQTPEEVGAEYAAGLIDGEGYIGITKAACDKWPHVIINIGITDPRPLRALKKRYGGSMNRRTPNGLGKLPQWYWAMSYGGGPKKKNNNTKETLEDILPFLIIKRLNALLALEFIRCAENRWEDAVRTPEQFVEASKIFNTNPEFHLRVVGE